MSQNVANNKGSLAVLLSGRGSNFISILQHSRGENANFKVTVVISDRGDAPGLAHAQAEGLPSFYLNPQTYRSRRDYEQEICRILTAHQVDLVCLAGYMRIVGQTLLAKYPGRVFNIHPSLLPAFPGLNAQKQALEWGVKVSGCTVHVVDEGMDSGPIILQKAVPILKDDDEDALSQRILQQEHLLYPQAISLYFSGRLKTQGRRIQVNP